MRLSNFLMLLLLIGVTSSCTKKQELQNAQEQVVGSKSAQADVVYHYEGKAYAFHYKEGSTEDFVEDETYWKLRTITAEKNIVTFSYSNKPANYIYLFDDEFEGYDFIEKDGRPLIGRKFKMALRIDQLREKLIMKFGQPLDFKDTELAEVARNGVQKIYKELKVSSPFPKNIQSFIGVRTDKFSKEKTGSAMSSAPVLTVWEHADAGGSEMYVEQAPNTVIWDYGDYNCYTMAANPDLTLEFQPNGNNWNDCISSKCLSYIQGADAMAEGYYKDSHFGVYSCGYAVREIEPATINALPGPCWNMQAVNWVAGPFCGHMNDQISSIRIKAIWQGCPITYQDMYNL